MKVACATVQCVLLRGSNRLRCKAQPLFNRTPLGCVCGFPEFDRRLAAAVGAETPSV